MTLLFSYCYRADDRLSAVWRRFAFELDQFYEKVERLEERGVWPLHIQDSLLGYEPRKCGWEDVDPDRRAPRGLHRPLYLPWLEHRSWTPWGRGWEKLWRLYPDVPQVDAIMHLAGIAPIIIGSDRNSVTVLPEFAIMGKVVVVRSPQPIRSRALKPIRTLSAPEMAI